MALPAIEVDWMASTAFNHAVDLFLEGDDDGCRKWAAAALNLAAFAGTGLESELQGRYASLKLDS